MARRRINTKFIGTGFIILVGLAVAGVVVKKFFIHEDPQQYVRMAKKYANDGQWERATANFAQATRLLPRDSKLLVEYGISEAHLATPDNDYRSRAEKTWRQAVEADPNNNDAWMRLLELYQQDLRMLEASPKNDRTRPILIQYFGLVRETATQVVRLSPGDVRNQSIVPSLNIRLWLLDIPIPDSVADRTQALSLTDEQKVDKAVAELSALQEKDPENADIPLWIGRVKAHRGELAVRSGHSSDASPMFAEAATVFDEPIRDHPKNVALYQNKYYLLSRLLGVDTRPDKRADYIQQLHEALDTAQSLVDPKMPTYMGVKLAWAQNLSATDPARAEQVYQDLITKYPAEIGPKISLATMLQKDASRRDDALAVLQQLPEAPPIAVSGARQDIESQLTDAKFIRTNIQIDKYLNAPAGKDKEKLADDLKSTFDAMSQQYGNDARFLKCRGKFELAQRRTREAIQTLEAALSQNTAQGLPPDVELLQLAADAYQHGQQAGKAIELLEQAIQEPALATKLRPHMALAQLYLNNRDTAKAKEQIAWLAELFPNAAEVIKMDIQTMDPVVDHDAILADYGRLPESTPEQMQEKAQLAHHIGNDPDAARLLKLIFTNNPTDVRTAVTLIQMDIAAGKNDEARQIAKDALKATPNDSALTVLSASINGATPQAIHDDVVKEVEKNNPDPFDREMRLAELGASENNSSDELTHLKKAEAIRPNDTTILKRLFGHYLAAGQFDQAEAYLPKLTQADADQAHGLLLHMQLALVKRDGQTAMAVGRQLVSEFPQFANSWESLGEALQLSGQPDAAAQKYLVALQKQATNIPALRHLIEVSYQLGKFDDAKRYILDARQKFPNDQIYRDMEVEHELRFGDPDSILPGLLDAVKNGPDTQRNYFVATDALVRAAAVRTTKGDAEGARRDIAQARDVLQQAVARWPDSFEFSSKLAQLCTTSGDLPAGEAVAKALAARPQWKDQPGPLAVLAQIYMEANKPELAEAPLREAMVKLKGQDTSNLQLELSKVLAAEGKVDDALKALDANQNSPAVIKQRLELLLSSNRGPQAESEITTAIKANPANSQLTDLLIFVYFREQKLDETIALATQAITTNPKDYAARYYRALVNLISSKPDVNSAAADLTLIRDADPSNVDARISLADALAMSGNLPDGTHELETALKYAPEHKVLRLKLLQFYEAVKPPRWFDAEQIITDALAIPQFKSDADFLRAAAVMWSARGDNERAITSIRAAMAQVPDKTFLVGDYLNILLAAKNYSLLLQESSALVAKPDTCPWWVYNLRGRAEAQSGDSATAIHDFTLALDKAGAERGHGPASAVADNISTDLSPDKAVELIAPRTENSLKWKMVAIPVLDRKGDRAAALSMAESAIASFSSLTPVEQDELLALTGSLYLTADPPLADKAIPIYKQILERHPDDKTAMNNLACLLAELVNPPQPAEGLKYSQAAYDSLEKMGRVDPMIYDTHGWVLILAGQVDNGINVLQKVIDKSDFPDAHYHLAEGYLRKKQPENAQREIDVARALVAKKNKDGKPADPAMKVLSAKIESASKRASDMVLERTGVSANP